MKLNATIISAALLTALPSHAKLSVEFDRYTDKTELETPTRSEMNARLNGGRLVPNVLTFFPGEKPQRTPLMVRLALRSISKSGWQYLRCHRVDALADGRPFKLPPAGHDGEPLQGSTVFESVHVDLSWADFSRLATAKSVELRVCNTEFKVSPADLKDWEALVAAGTPRRP